MTSNRRPQPPHLQAQQSPIASAPSPHRSHGRRVAAIIAVSATALAGIGAAPLAASAVVSPDAALVINEVYGGGGNSGATYKNDFIELFNPSDEAVTVDGWTVQYASTAGNSWARTPLAGTIEPGEYYLVQQAAGSGGTLDLPTPDATGTIAMSGTGAKVALVSSDVALTGAAGNAAGAASVVDFVGWGSASDFAGTAPAPATTNPTR